MRTGWPRLVAMLALSCLCRAEVSVNVNQEPISFPDDHGLRVLYGWKLLDFEFPDEATRNAAITDGRFVPVNNVLIDVDVYEKGGNRTVFVTVPRVRPGVPATLATLSTDRRDADGQPLLRPFPDWKTNTGIHTGDCENSITSVFRTTIDECGRLWVLDSGRTNAWDVNATTVCDPKVLVFDLKNEGRLIGKYSVPRTLLEEPSLLVTIVVEVVGFGKGRCGRCGLTYAYIADTPVFHMLVLELRYGVGRFWRVDSALFASDPEHYQFTVHGLSFEFHEGLFGMALSPKFRGGRRRLYFHGIASVRQSWVETSVLRNRFLWTDGTNASAAFRTFSGGVRPSQSVVSAMSERGLLFFGLTGSDELACWDSQRPFVAENIVSLLKDEEKLQFNTGMKLRDGKLHLVTNRIQNYVNNRVAVNEVNYRIMEVDVKLLTEGTACEARSEPADNRFGVRGGYEPYSEPE